MPALSRAMAEEGFVLADKDVKVVVAGMDTEITFDKIKCAVRLIREHLALHFDSSQTSTLNLGKVPTINVP